MTNGDPCSRPQPLPPVPEPLPALVPEADEDVVEVATEALAEPGLDWVSSKKNYKIVTICFPLLKFQ